MHVSLGAVPGVIDWHTIPREALPGHMTETETETSQPKSGLQISSVYQ